MTIDRLRSALGGLLAVVAWAFLAVLIAAGAAGLVTALDHVPGTPARAELTWAADEAATADLDAAQAQFETLQGEVDALGVQARGALASLIGQDLETVQSTVDEGARLVAGIRDQSTAIRLALLRVPGVIGETAGLTTSGPVRARHAAMLSALALTDELDDAWVNLTTGSLAAARLSGLLADHDRIMGEALAAGRAGDYDEAIATIDQAAALLDQADVMRQQLANTVDVSTLVEWISRNRAYEDALRGLYAAVDSSGGRQTAAVREALIRERAARRDLPPDSRGLVVIMGEIGRGGLNGAVITIEEARGSLARALAGLAPSTPAP
jgi:hypothetical protein